MEQFEYLTYLYDTAGFFGGKVDVEELQYVFNGLGKDGWELVSSVDTNQTNGATKSILFVFKRRM